MQSILLVEDSPEAQVLVKRALGQSYNLTWAKTLAEATKAVEDQSFDLILLDVMLPDGDGYRLCSILQTNDSLKNTPIIFLTARNSVTDKVLGFKVGADDFISKPFDALELKARVDARLRKKEQQLQASDVIRLGHLEINKSTQRVKVFHEDHSEGEGIDIDLTPIEFKMLLLLTKEVNKVYSRDEILDTVWGENIHVYNRSVDTHISKLRKKLGNRADYIESVHGSGYRFSFKSQPKAQVTEPPVQVLAHPQEPPPMSL